MAQGLDRAVSAEQTASPSDMVPMSATRGDAPAATQAPTSEPAVTRTIGGRTATEPDNVQGHLTRDGRRLW